MYSSFDATNNSYDDEVRRRETRSTPFLDLPIGPSAILVYYQAYLIIKSSTFPILKFSTLNRTIVVSTSQHGPTCY